MSERTGIPFSTLSKVERGQLTLTYDRLQQLGQRLNMRMSELFAEPESHTAARVTARRSLGTLETAVHVDTQNYDYFYLCPDLRSKRMIPIYVKIRAKTLEEFGELQSHSGEEWIYVVEGRIEVHTEFYDKMCLGAGQSIYLDSTMGHAYLVGDGCDEAVIVCACSSAEEDLMGSLINAHTEDHG
jgi:transcriptional regulator with XRE-family HTH domain